MGRSSFAPRFSMCFPPTKVPQDSDSDQLCIKQTDRQDRITIKAATVLACGKRLVKSRESLQSCRRALP